MLWWQSLQSREKLLVAIAGFSLFAFLYWVALWRPLTSAVVDTRERLTRAQAQTIWMESAAVEAQRLKAVKPVSRPGGSNASLLALAEQTARSKALGKSFRRGEPVGDNRVRIWMENVAFDGLLLWLEELDRAYAVQVEAADIDQIGTPGLVNARITLVEF